MVWPAWVVQAAWALAAVLVSVAFTPKPKQRDQKNDAHRQGVDNDLERVYGTRRIGLVPTDHITAARQVSPASLASINDVIRSTLTYKGLDDSTSDSKKTTLMVEGPLCVAGRLNAPFQGSTAADVNPLVNEKPYTDASLKTDSDLNVGNGFELHLVGGVRHPLSAELSLGATTNVFTSQISATWEYVLNIEKDLVYSGIPDSTFDLTSNLLYDPNGGSDVWNDPTTWTGRAGSPILQLLDYLFDADFGVGLTITDIDALSWSFAATIGDVPTAVIKTTTQSRAYSFDTFGTWATSTVVKTQTPGYLLESNITLSTANGLNENIEELLAACRGAAIYKNRVGKWAINPDWIHEDDLVQSFTGETGTGPFAMDWPTTDVIVSKNTVELTQGVDYTITTTATLTTEFTYGSQDSQTGTDPDTVIGITFTSPLIGSDDIDIDYRLSGSNPDGILGMPTTFHIVDDPETLGLDYDATQDTNGVELILIADEQKSELAKVSLDDRFNQCVVKFPDKETKYKQNQVVWPADGSAQHTAFLTEDADKPLIKDISINSITDQEKALDYAEFIVRSSRSADTASFLLSTPALQLDINDTVLISDKRLNIDAELWRVKKLVPQPDTRVMVSFKRYDVEDYTYAVESFSQENVEMNHRPFGPVQNLAWAASNGTVTGSGVLTWDEPAGMTASSYVCAVSTKTVWDAVTTYAQNVKVYYDDKHYNADVAISAGAGNPSVNGDWSEVQDDNNLWLVFADTASLSAVTPHVSGTRSYAYRVQPKSALRHLGVPAYLDDVMVSISHRVVTSYFQASAPSGQDERDNDNWFDTDSDPVYDWARRESGAWVSHGQNGISFAFAGGHDPAVITRGRCHTFVWPDEPTDADTPGGALGEGDLWFSTYNLYQVSRYDGADWLPYQVLTDISVSDTDPQVNDSLTIVSDTAALANLKIYTDTSLFGTTHYFESSDDSNNQGFSFTFYDASGEANSFGFQLFDSDDTSFFTMPHNTRLLLDGELSYGPGVDQWRANDARIRAGFHVIGDSLTDVTSPNPESWARRLHDAGVCDITRDAANGRTVVAYTYPGTTSPAAGREHLIIELGTNDAGGGGTTPELDAFETALEDLLQDCLDDGWEADKIAYVLPFYNDAHANSKLDDYRARAVSACATKGITEVWAPPIGSWLYSEWSLGTGVHPTQEGQDALAQEMYIRMATWVSHQVGDIVTVPAGSASAPGLTFYGDSDTGVYLVGADALGITAGGTKRLGVTTTTVDVDSVLNLLQQGAGANNILITQSDIGTVNTLTFNTADNTQAYLFKMGSSATASMASGQISVSAAAPTSATHLARKDYVDAQIAAAPTGYIQGDVILADYGTVSLPGYAFDGDPDTGMYRVSANGLAWAVGGAQVLNASALGINAGVVVAGVNGAAGTPSFTFTSDVDTGIYRVAANTLGLSVGGTKRLEVNTSGINVVGNIYDDGVSLASIYAPISTTVTTTTTVAVAYGGTGATAKTGTGNNVLSASPTLTGTVSVAAISATGNITSTATVSGANLGATSLATSPNATVYANVFGALTLTPPASDYRLKTNLAHYNENEAIEALRNVPVRGFNWKTTGAYEVGFLAHEMQEWLDYPEIVQGEKDGEEYQTMSKAGLIPFLWAQNRALLNRIEEIERRQDSLDALRARVVDLERRC